MHNGNEPLPILTSPPMMKRMLVTGKDREGSTRTTHTGKSHCQVGSHVSQEQNERAMQREIDNLKKKLRHAQRKWTPSSFDISSNDEEDASYK